MGQFWTPIDNVKMWFKLPIYEGLEVFLEDARVQMGSNPVENTIRPLALNRKNALFAHYCEGTICPFLDISLLWKRHMLHWCNAGKSEIFRPRVILPG